MKKIIQALNHNRFLCNLAVVILAITFFLVVNHWSGIGMWISGILTILSPVLLGTVIAYLMNPAGKFLAARVFGRMKNRNAAYRLGVVLAFLLALVLLTLLVAAVVPQLVSSVGTLINQMPSYLTALQHTVNELDQKIEFLDLDAERIVGSGRTWFAKISAWAMTNLNSILGASAKIGSSILNVAFAIVVALYVLMDKATVKRMIRRVQACCMTPQTAYRVNAVVEKSNKALFSFVYGSVLDALIIGTANFLFMTLLGMPYTMLITVVVAVTNLIPIFGPFVGAFVGGLVLLVIQPWQALWFLLFTAVLQAMDSYVIKSFLFGNTTGLRPLWVFVAVLIGGRLFGVLGMLLGIPVAAVGTWLVAELMNRHLASKGFDPDGTLEKKTVNGEQQKKE